MIEFIVLEKTADGALEGRGPHTFHATPPTGEYLTMDDATGSEQAYRILAVVHAVDPSATGAAGDLLIRHLGNDVDFLATV